MNEGKKIIKELDSRIERLNEHYSDTKDTFRPSRTKGILLLNGCTFLFYCFTLPGSPSKYITPFISTGTTPSSIIFIICGTTSGSN